MVPQYPFFNSVRHLRAHENLILYDQLLEVSKPEKAILVDYLYTEYQQEQLCHPSPSLSFHKQAAFWAAETVFFACQFLLHRELDKSDLEELLPPFQETFDAAAQVSADLCLRFLPSILKHAQILDPEDVLIPNLEQKLERFHYSGIGYDLDRTQLNFNTITIHPCLQQLYVDRIIQKKAILLAEEPALKPLVLASLGIHSAHFWPALAKG